MQAESAPRPPLEVTFQNGLLSIVASKATLSEVLYAVQQRTGADIAIPAGAEQERVVASFEPAPAPEVLARLLNGSNFNFLILSAPDDPRHVDRVILSPRSEGGMMPLAPMQASSPPAEEDVPPVAEPPNDVAAAPPAPPVVAQPQDGPPPPQDDSNQ